MACLKAHLRFYVEGINRAEDNNYHPLTVDIVGGGGPVPVTGH
jgi:hypothetical protein